MRAADPQKTILVIGGPTASGKSGMAVAVAEKFSGTVINGDSLQLYQGLPILTAQPSAEEKLRAPHRLYGMQPPEKPCDAAQWRQLALDEITRTHADNKLPVIVGGSGFYLKTLLQGISPIPDIPHGLRDKISALQKSMGNPAFHQELAKRDPVMAAKLHPFNTQRLVRAWEVLEATGKSLADWQALPRVAAPAHLKFITVFILPLRDALYAACNKRFEQMLDHGALDEVRQFRDKYPAENGLSKALGYPELCAHLDGKTSLAEAATSAQQSTRHYAKRQVTWFRHQIPADLICETATPPFDWVAERIFL